jgi:hypothetical protein
VKIDRVLRPAQLLSWDDSHGHRFTHDLFKFPGKFHPPIVENILRQLTSRAVIDPMAGVGTVAVEAKIAGIPSLSIDVDPVSVFFARVKTTPICRATLDAAWKDLQPFLRRVRRPQRQIEDYRFQDIAPSTMRKYLAALNARRFESLGYWFRRYVLVDYARLDESLWNGGLPHRGWEVRRFFKACLLSAARRISNADPYPVSGLEITKHMRARLAAGYEIDVFAEFERRVRLNIARMESYVSYLRDHNATKTRAAVVQGDCLDILKIKEQFGFEADLILFSPPYCNAIEYWRRHQLEYYMGGFLTKQEIPAHNRRFVGRRAIGGRSAPVPPVLTSRIDETISALHAGGRRVKAWQLWHYFNDMNLRLRNFFSALPQGGRAVIVVGDSRTSGHEIPTASLLQDFALTVGFGLEATVRYAIKNRTMQYPLREGDAKIAEESIIVLQKPAA